MSSGKPPLLIDSTTLSLPSTMSAPVRPRRIRSSPSRSAVPGATAARVALSRSSSVRSTGVTTAPCPPARRPRPARPLWPVGSRGSLTAAGPRRAGTSSAATTAPATSATSTTRSPSGIGPEPRTPRGVNATRNPSRAASASRRGIPDTGRSSPASPTSPKATACGGRAAVDDGAGDAERDGEVGGRLAEAHAADRRDVGVAAADGDVARGVSRTARTIATRDAVEAVACARRGDGGCCGAMSACTSATSGRRPSRVTVTQVPATLRSRLERNSPLGSASPTMPTSDRSKQPTSSVGP